MLLEYAEANVFYTSGAPNEFAEWALWPKAAGHIWGGAARGRPPLCATLVLKALASAYFKSIDLPFF